MSVTVQEALRDLMWSTIGCLSFIGAVKTVDLGGAWVVLSGSLFFIAVRVMVRP